MYEVFLKEMQDTSIMCDSLFAQNKNTVIDRAITLLPKAELFIKILWRKIFLWLKKHIKEQLGDTSMTMAFLKDVTKKVWFITCCEEVRALLMVVLSTDEKKSFLEEADICFCSDLATKIYHQILEIVANSVRQNITKAAIEDLKVIELDNAGLSKIRFLGGYVAHRLLDECKRYVNDNVYSEQHHVAKRVSMSMDKVRLLTENIIVPYEKICESTKYPDTLDYIERRQYASRGLLHVSDSFYEYMLKLEQARVNHLKISKYKELGENFLFEIKKQIVADDSFKLKQGFFELFQNHSPAHDAELEKSLMEELFQSSIDLYVRVGAKEVLKDFKRCYSLKKTMAHRHMVLMRTQKKERKKAKLEMEEFKKDRSPNKSVSHAKLKGMVLQFGDAFLWTVYKVPEIRRLCAASDVPIPTAVKKKVDIAKLVIPVIKQTNQFKCSYFLDELRAEQHDEQRPEGPIRIRIRRDIA
eukprot:Seg5949.2 transcript_id=Seg5949.2/GoldUCD/mRNA.D3Y31 product="hypothetical protein" protein_id=Seg5949.2/GoldUCD/D3Y31